MMKDLCREAPKTVWLLDLTNPDPDILDRATPRTAQQRVRSSSPVSPRGSETGVENCVECPWRVVKLAIGLHKLVTT